MKKTKEIERYLKYQKKLRALNLVKEGLKVMDVCDIFKISKTTFYNWKNKYEKDGKKGLERKIRSYETYGNRISDETIELILKLRKEHNLGTWRIKWYLERYHGIEVSESSVYRTLKRNNIKPLHRSITRRAMVTKRYEKKTPGHHVQIDVKFLIFCNNKGEKIRRFQYTAIDDCTRIRALKVYDRHTQVNAIKFLDYVVEKFPFRINTIQTDNGHEFQSRFHWYVQDCGMYHRYIKPGKPQHNGKVERSYLIDKREFYQLLDYKDDVDLKKKLNDWEQFYNFDRPHGAFNGKTPHETLKTKLKN
ncbi:IS481 family transposase [Flavobacteriales bacterium]|nr:IS481 family transposase [Flavobacteriales bacterium]